MDFLLLEGANIWDVYRQYYADKIDEQTFNILAHIDPTAKGDQKGKYLPWIIKEYFRILPEFEQIGYTTLDEWLKPWSSDLAWYDKHKLCPEVADKYGSDINRLTSNDLSELVEDLSGNVFTQKEIRSQADIVYNDASWEIVIPKTWAASKLYGANTEWCTTEKDDSHYFDRYNAEGPLYINIDKKNNTKWQFHPASNTYCDENDGDLFDDGIIEDESVADYMNMPNNVIEWYRTKLPKVYEKITEVLNPDWTDYQFFSSNGEFIGYIVDGCLYDQDKDRVGYTETYSEYIEYMGCGGFALEHNNGYDFFELTQQYHGYYPSLAFEDISNVNLIDEEDEGTGILIGLDDSDGGFVYMNLYDGSSDYTTERNRSYDDYKIWSEDERIIILYDTRGKIDLVSLYSNDIVIANDIFVDREHWIDFDPNHPDNILFYRKDENGELHLFTICKFDGWDDEEEVNIAEFEEEPEEELVQTENIKSEFWGKLNKLNEIHKRNSPLRLD